MSDLQTNSDHDCDAFYDERDRRTSSYLGERWTPTHSATVLVDPADLDAEPVQHLLRTLVNLLTRSHRTVEVVCPSDDGSRFGLGKDLAALAAAVDPCGKFRWWSDADHAHIAIGAPRSGDADWYVGFEGSIATVSRTPQPLDRRRGGIRGAGLAACLAQAVFIRTELGLETSERRLSAWNYCEGEAADPGPADLAPVNVGRTLIVGAGAVASCLVYWLQTWGVEGHFTIVDRDRVALHNTNRSLVFYPEHAGWPGTSHGLRKAEVISRHLPSATAVPEWYADYAKRMKLTDFDVVLALASGGDVRWQLAHLPATVMLHATTGTNWLSQLHRHVAGSDDCIACRLPQPANPPRLQCSEGTIQSEAVEQSDAALPFLSAASGLMLATALQRLQAGQLLDTRANTWSWDFQSSHVMASAGRSGCEHACTTLPSPVLRRRLTRGTRWAHLDTEDPGAE